jgi:hypothetical protein
MDQKSDREELQQRLEQAKRMAAFGCDTVTNERLQKLVQELEEQLRTRSRRAPLRWRSQTSEPTGCFKRFHRIN